MKKKSLLGVMLALVIASSALVPLTDTALAQSANLSRSFLPDNQVLRDESFDVIVTFTASADGFNSIGLRDNVPAGWAIQVDTSWCTPNADFSSVMGDEAQYVWIGPYNSGQVFTAIYHVTVPSGAPSGTHLFNGQLNYYIVRNGPFSEDIGGDLDVTVTIAEKPFRYSIAWANGGPAGVGKCNFWGGIEWEDYNVYGFKTTWWKKENNGDLTLLATHILELPERTVSGRYLLTGVLGQSCGYEYLLEVDLLKKNGKAIPFASARDWVTCYCD
jgi:hypothetical protein